MVPEEFNIPSDGILGKDFLKKFNCNINYNNMTLTIYMNNVKIVINILEGPDENTVVIPPRAEVVRNFHIKSQIVSARYVPNQELISGVFTSNTIIDSDQAFITPLNM